MKTLYKVLNNDLTSPFQGFQFELNKTYRCENFDQDIHNDCSNGFYATDIDGLIYSFRNNGEYKIFECEVWGKQVEIDQFKRRYECFKLIKECDFNFIKKKAKKFEKKLGYKYSEALFPFDPRNINRKRISKKDIELLKIWASVRDSVGDSVWDSVWASVRDSVGDSVWASVGASVWAYVWAYVRDSVGDSVGASIWASVWASVGDSVRDSVWDSVRTSVWDSVWDSVRAYVSNLFPNIKKWKYVEHKEGINPFQSGIELWYRGIVPSFDGKIWRLHGGKNMDILFSIDRKDLVV